MWEAIADDVERAGIPVELGPRVTRLRHANGRIELSSTGRRRVRDPRGRRRLEHPAVRARPSLDPLPDDAVVAAARGLRYRDLIVVGLVSSDPEPFPDNWIYLHDPGTRAGRVQNFGAWSAGMIRPGYTCLGVEYFCFAGDDLWDMPDNALVQLAARARPYRPARPGARGRGQAIRVRRAYPVYDASYRDAVRRLRRTVDGFENLETVGRNGSTATTTRIPRCGPRCSGR